MARKVTAMVRVIVLHLHQKYVKLPTLLQDTRIKFFLVMLFSTEMLATMYVKSVRTS